MVVYKPLFAVYEKKNGDTKKERRSVALFEFLPE